jgi:hypothetical protein
MEILIIVLLVIAIIAVAIVACGYTTRCPNCKKMFARKLTSRDELGREGKFKTVTRQDITRDASGKEVFRTQRQEQVHVTDIKYENHFTCKYCQHTWDAESVSEQVD